MPKLARDSARRVEFIEPMECLPVAATPTGGDWTYEIKLDGYRLEVVKNDGQVQLFSRRRRLLNAQFPQIVATMSQIPNGTVVDGELCALDEAGRPSFNLLQNYRSTSAPIIYFAFDLLVHKTRDLTREHLYERRAVLESIIEPNDHLSLSVVVNTSAAMLNFVKKHGFEGIVAKRAGSVYQPGQRSGLWAKQRINLSQEFVIGGFVPSNLSVDSLIFGVYKDKALHYIGRTRAGFVPATRKKVFDAIKHLKISSCPFVNLPEVSAGRWNQGLTAEKMNQCVWVRPEVVAQIEFVEWTGGEHLRHTRFIGLRDDKDPRKVVRET